MTTYWLRFTLQSAATFGRGDGVPGLVDREVEHDSDGLPYLRGRTLRGLLREECANILFALEGDNETVRWHTAGNSLFGKRGSQYADQGSLRVGDARLPAELRDAVRLQIQDDYSNLKPVDVLESLTGIRRQTAMTAYGAPEKGSLRSMRVILRGLTFEAPLDFAEKPSDDQLALLAACVLAWRRAGTGRNRGRGRLQASLHSDDQNRPDITETQFHEFQRRVRP